MGMMWFYEYNNEGRWAQAVDHKEGHKMDFKINRKHLTSRQLVFLDSRFN